MNSLRASLRRLAVLLVFAGLTAAAWAQAEAPGAARHTACGSAAGSCTDALATTRFVARVQVIQNTPDAGPLDVYVNGRRLADDAEFQTATAFAMMQVGEARIDVVAGGEADESNPLLSKTLTLRRDVNYVAVVTGRRDSLRVLVQDNIRLASTTPNLEYIFIHGSPDIGPLDVRILDPISSNDKVTALLVNNLSFGEIIGYQGLPPAGYNIQVTNADNSVEYEVFRLELHFFGRQTLTFLTSGLGSKASQGFTLIGFDIFGNPVRASVITASEGAEELPTEFALDGNYPNPFNPSTTIQYDLPETAEVSVQIYDMLGRNVMTVPAKMVEAGAKRSVQVNAASLASGTYLYRLVAQTATDTMVKTGRMTLVK